MLNFTKMHGLGNDFIIIDNLKNNISFSKKQIKLLANRNFGIGFDQLLMVGNSTIADFKYTIYNSDGELAEQCGNGARCFARFVLEKKLSKKNPLLIETSSGIMSLFINNDNSVSVNMGAVSFSTKDAGFITNNKSINHSYELEGQKIGIVSIGNPHAIIITEDLDLLNIKPIAQAIQKNRSFINGVNVGFMQIISRNKIKLRVYERGAGETLACGSGACTAVAYGKHIGMLDSKVVVKFIGGDAGVTISGSGNLTLKAPAEFVFEGQLISKLG